MKKNYYMVLVALFSFALNAFAQEDKWETVTAPGDTEAQTEAYNMVITLPDGTTFTVNTDEVDAVQFSNGQVTLSGTSIQQLLTALTALQAEEDATLANVEWLHSRCTQLENSIQANFTDILQRLVGLETYVPLIAQKVEQALNLGEAANARITTLETNYSVLSYDVQEALRIAREASAMGQTNIGRIDEQQDRISNLESEIYNLIKEIMVLKDRVAELENK